MMKIKVYVDVLLAETWFLYVMFLILTKLLMQALGKSGNEKRIGRRKTICCIRIGFAALLGSILQILQLFIQFKNHFFASMYGMLSTAVMFCIAWKQDVDGKKKIQNICLEICCFYFFHFVFGGAWRFVIVWLHRNVRNWRQMRLSTFGLLMVSLLLCFAIIGGIYMIKRKRSLSCVVEIYFDQQMIRTKAFIDTGNSLRDPISNQPVSIVESKLFSQISSSMQVAKTDLCCIPYHAIGKEGILWGIHSKEMKIIRDGHAITKKHAIIAFYDGILSRRGDYQMLLHPDMLINSD